MLKKISAFLELLRPLEWSKALGNMILGAFLAIYLLDKSFNFFDFNFGLLFFAFTAVGPLLWGGLYALNDYTDWQKDKLHPVKKQRPLPSNRINPKTGLLFALSCIALAFLIGFAINNTLFLFCLFAMLINQLLYTLKPFSLKKRAVLDLISGSLVNPFFRFYSGWVLFQQNFNAPIQIIVFVLCLQYSGYALYRLSSKDHEKELGYKSSIVMFSENSIKFSAYTALFTGILAFVFSCLSILPQRFLLLAVGSVLLLPIYRSTLHDPKKIDLKKMHSTIYWHYIFFIAGFVLLFFL